MRLWRDTHLQTKIEKKKVPQKKNTRRSGVRGALAEPDACSAGTFATSSSSFEVGTRTEFGNVKPPAVKLLHERTRPANSASDVFRFFERCSLITNFLKIKQ